MLFRTSTRLIALSFLISQPLAAAWQGENAVKIQHISELKGSPVSDDQKIVVEGRLIKEISPELYLFRDQSGDIPVEIDHETWHGIDVNKNTQIRIIGELDSEWGDKRLDVDRIEVISNN